MIKQTIIVRKDLNMRKGKMIAQGAHASIKALFSDSRTMATEHRYDYQYIVLEPEMDEWFNGLQTKICLGIDSERELLDLFIAAKQAGLRTGLIQDTGLTEFKEPTYTAVAIGPNEAKEIDKLTATLKLL